MARRKRSLIHRLPPVRGGRETTAAGLHPVYKSVVREIAAAEKCSISYLMVRMIEKYIGIEEPEDRPVKRKSRKGGR
jgi:hypothetical protein